MERLVSPGWSLLIEATLKGTLILFIASLVLPFLRRRSAAARHWVWLLAASGLVSLPVGAVLLPVWRVPLLPETGAWSYASAKIGQPFLADEVDRATRSGGGATEAAVLHGKASPSLESAAKSPPRPVWIVRLLFLWAGGAIAVGLWLATGDLRARRIVRLATRLDTGPVHRSVQSMRRRIGLGTPVSVLRSDRVQTPMTLGVIQPLLIVPAAAEGWSLPRLRAVALHELHHIRRYDTLTQRAADLACALYWFHPAVWYSARRLRVERERACDDCVIRSGIRPSRYARHLLDIARAARAGVPAPAVAMARRSGFEERVEAILDPDVRREPPSRRGIALATALVACIVLPLAALDPWRQATSAVTAAVASRSVIVTLRPLAPGTPAPIPPM